MAAMTRYTSRARNVADVMSRPTDISSAAEIVTSRDGDFSRATRKVVGASGGGEGVGPGDRQPERLREDHELEGADPPEAERLGRLLLSGVYAGDRGPECLGPVRRVGEGQE